MSWRGEAPVDLSPVGSPAIRPGTVRVGGAIINRS
jgi:hypothetical protein